MRPEVSRLVSLGPMPDELEQPSIDRVLEYQRALETLPRRLTPEESIALLDSFPSGENGSLYELEWALVHAIESALGPELLAELDERSWWVAHLRLRAERAGLL